MKNLLLFLGLILTKLLLGQDYFPFPTDYANWNCIVWYQSSPWDESIENYEYVLEGDTLIDSKTYKKVFHIFTEYSAPPVYIGGLREDTLKNVYFYPHTTSLPTYFHDPFPNDTSEHLLYTFDSLYIGMLLPINTGNSTIEVVNIDSILIGNNYRKRYEIFGSQFIFPDFWIEGIGSTKDLFSPYAVEFEWSLFTLCYSDTTTYFLTALDTCYYSLPTRISETKNSTFSIYPNPAKSKINIICNSENHNALLSIFSIQGKILHTLIIENKETKLDMSFLEKGFYVIRITVGSKIETIKFFKK